MAVVDSRPFGGTCALRGCDPKKVLVGAAALIDWIRRMESTGDNARIEWPELMRFKRTFTDPVSKLSTVQHDSLAQPMFKLEKMCSKVVTF